MAWMGILGSPARLRNDLLAKGYMSIGWSKRLLHSGCSSHLPEDTSRDISSSANSDHKVRVEFIQYSVSRSLTELVDLSTDLVSIDSET